MNGELDWKARVVACSIFSVRCQKRIDGSAFRVEFTFANGDDFTLFLTSVSDIQATIVPTALPEHDPSWSDSKYTVGNEGPPDNQEIRQLFHKLWSSAGTSLSEKAEWKRLRSALTRGGYKL